MTVRTQIRTFSVRKHYGWRVAFWFHYTRLCNRFFKQAQGA